MTLMSDKANYRVSLVKTRNPDGEGIKDAVFEAIDLCDFKWDSKAKKVVIKPNLCYYWDSSTGETTDKRVVAAVIDFVRERISPDCEISIVETDASAMKIKYAYRMLGYEDLAEEKHITLVNGSKEDIMEKEACVNGKSCRLRFPTSLFNSDLIINVPKLKVGPFASGKALHITCALKNLYGCIAVPKKVVYHSNIDEVIVAVNKMVKPHLTLVDGIVAKGKHPCKLNLIMAGTNGVCVDYVAPQIMGYNPFNVSHLRLAIKEGVTNFNGVKVVGEKLEEFRKEFPKVNNFMFKWSWKLQFSLLNLYAKITGDTIPPAVE